ncbi:phospholipid-translocating P-type ATPase [Pseudovirgaria hyperparasitica]|uniref:Phospholipid-transporting ATPase n=1 Tax=Pseudovirgaria hyperparasitica TaxID=470096 RepID=A0A6A6WHX2_9PEZI|nr:phospholipid-translocating P-type ATPase [Pseudovirgaria hyperparasitica]KAF2762402.1 phospholipid-translocating P-type ATPase [Pseudovirgaria hyperparasitica]
MAVDKSQLPESERSNPVKRIRWATHRIPGAKGDRKRQSLLARLPIHSRSGSSEKHKRDSMGKDSENGQTNGEQSTSDDQSESDGSVEQRAIFFNIPLPPNARDEEGHPLVRFPRNKIRTAKYTPLSFVPKNLWFQFHNIANVYFLFIVILGFFTIFGVENPGLAAVPLIVIVIITAIKDAVEDWRRTVLDIELNNAPVHRLIDFNNVNSAEDQISIWRRIKKASSRGVTFLWRRMKALTSKKEKGKSYAERAVDQGRASIDTKRASMYSPRASFQAPRNGNNDDDDGIQMTPVPSPLQENHPFPPAQDQIGIAISDHGGLHPDTAKAQSETPHTRANNLQPARFYGSLIDPHKPTPDKARFKKDYWKNVQVGDFVRLYNEDEIPADIVVLSTSDTDGACYVETKNLDGETNLKVRQALRCGRDVKHARQCEQCSFIIESEGPQPNLYSYSGVIRWEQKDIHDPQAPTVEMAEPVTINNLLLRGCTVRNTDWIVGVVVYTGEETKIMLNAGITPSKRAKISKDLNWNVIYNFIILFFMCLVAGIVQGIFWAKDDTSHSLFEFGSYGNNNASLDGTITFWAALILFQNLVPISLYITLEIIRTLQAVFIYNDTQMYYEKIDYPCTPKSWNISDDLGQIEYIFSDKTGTLTQNVMEFKKATINGVPYGEAYTEAQAGLHRRQGINVEEESARAKEQIAKDRVRMIGDLRRMHDNPYLRDEDLTFVAPDYVADLAGEAGEEQRQANEQFMLALALCHTVITERTPGDPPKLEFRAQSPDEAALVATARDCGFTVLGHTTDGILVNILGEEREYTILNTLEFNSTRKRMSSILRMPDGRIVLFCKGADSIIYSRLKRGEQPELRKETAEHLEMFAREGLRTLCIAMRELDEDTYQEWNKEHDRAASAVENREEKLETVASAIEQEMTLLGGTAIEDRLQDGVPDSIALLGKAGIKLWVLTGDKVETAINIGFSCNLLDNDMDLITLNIEDGTLQTAEAELDMHLQKFNMTGSDEELAAAQTNHEPPDPRHGIVIDGDSLKLVLDDSLRQKFLLLCKQCKAVLCCRVSPAQKAAVVRMVKHGLDCLTLAIGDGANDVAMIQEAHVGVGIAGEEGRQAVMSSDYAIGQFRFLTRLVLVHGRWSYRRLAETIANFFYKNIVWVFALFWYQIYAQFDCSYVYDYTYIIMYNLAFTSLPVILMGVLDQDVDDKVSLAVPQLYRRGIERLEWTQPKFWAYMLDGLYQSVICFYMVYLLFAPATFNTENGLGLDDLRRLGVYIVSSAAVCVNLYVLMNTYRWDWLMLLIVSISCLLIWLWTGAYTTSTYAFQFYHASQVYGSLSFWAVWLLIIIMALLPRFLIKSIQKIYFPYDIDIVREQVRQGKFDYLKDVEGYIPPPPDKVHSHSSSNVTKSANPPQSAVDEDQRPIYPPSVAPTATTHNARSQNGSDSTNYSLPAQRQSIDFSQQHRPNSMIVDERLARIRSSMDRPRPSYDRARMSMDRVRPSFEANRDFTSAAMLTRMESSNSGNVPIRGLGGKVSRLRHALSTASKRSAT